MTDKQVTVAIPEDRVPEFYSWFAAFLAAEPGTPPPSRGRGRHASRALRRPSEASAWSTDDADQAAWLYRKLAPPAQRLFDILLEEPGRRVAGERIANQLGLEKGAHGVAGILAWPGRYSRHVNRALPIATEGRADGGTDYYIEPETAALFATARSQTQADTTAHRHRRSRPPR